MVRFVPSKAIGTQVLLTISYHGTTKKYHTILSIYEDKLYNDTNQKEIRRGKRIAKSGKMITSQRVPTRE